MFDKNKEGKFISKNNQVIENFLVNNELLKSHQNNSCINAADTKRAIRTSFQFIKDNPTLIDEKVASTHITLYDFLNANEDSTINEFKYSVTTVDGIIKEVCESYVVLEATNSLKEKFEVYIVYEDIVYFWNITISDNFEAYVNYINLLPLICKDLNSESYNLLVRLAQILSKNSPSERDFVFIMSKILTRSFKAKDISILRNLIVAEELFIIPITSIQGFSQIPNK